jgi:hypothetical protein
MYPHGGINRMRLFGQPIDTPDEQDRLDALAAMPEAERRALFGRWCAARRYVDAMMAHGRFPTVHGLLVASLEALDGLSEPDWLEAFDGHPKLGEAKQAARADAEGARLSSQEQAGVQAAAAATLARLAEGNAAYAARHGFIFILFANIIGLFPWSFTVTSHIAVTFAFPVAHREYVDRGPRRNYAAGGIQTSWMGS